MQGVQGRLVLTQRCFFQRAQYRRQSAKTQGIAAAGKAMGQVRDLGAVAGLERFGQRALVLFDGIAQNC
ncbi:hypothetical protein D3C77_712780 [compost metagenome]